MSSPDHKKIGITVGQKVNVSDQCPSLSFVSTIITVNCLGCLGTLLLANALLVVTNDESVCSPAKEVTIAEGFCCFENRA